MSHSDKILARSIPFSSDEALQIGELLSLSLKMPRNWKTNCPNHLPDFNLQCFKTEEWIISFISHHCNVLFSNIFILKNLTCFPKLNYLCELVLTWRQNSISGSNDFHTKLRGIYDLLSINIQPNQAKSSTQEISLFFFFLQFYKMHFT